MINYEIFDLNYNQDSEKLFEYFRLQPYACFLDSCYFSENKNKTQFDIISALPWAFITYDHAQKIRIHKKNKTITLKNSDPIEQLEKLVSSMTPIQNKELPFTGGAIGYCSYNFNQYLFPKHLKSENINIPLLAFGLYHWAIITDHLKKKTLLFFHPDCPIELKNKVANLIKKAKTHHSSFNLLTPFKAGTTKNEYQKAFKTIKEYIYAGDCYQVNLTQQFSSKFKGDSWEAYKILRKKSPSPFSSFLDFKNFQILSHSPERFIKINQNIIDAQPIKGTIARGFDLSEDKKNILSLSNSTKDHAENLMIVDLLRNDLGKICKTGSIKVLKLCQLESYSNVHHLVSYIKGELSININIFQAFKHVFPGGSITGAPKIRAMQIINEIENHDRNVYCGNISYMSTNSRLDSNIAIRSLLTQQQNIYCWGGGAIVADSNFEDEYQESMYKINHLIYNLEKTLAWKA